MNRNPLPTITYDEADIDYNILQQARERALVNTMQHARQYPNNWTPEIWDYYSMVLLLIYLVRAGNLRHYGGLPVMRAEVNAQQVDVLQ